MSYKVKTIKVFERQAKRLTRKYPSLRKEIKDFKIRLAISSKGMGKSGGARVITALVAVESTVYLLSIYDKSEQATLTNKEVEELLQFIP